MTEAINVLPQLAGHGILGVLLVLALIWLWQKDKELKELNEARLNDVKSYSDKLHESIEKQDAIFEAVCKNKKDQP